MIENTRDTSIRHAPAAVSRRRSLRLFGGAGLAGAFAAPTVAGAGKKGKKARCDAGLAVACLLPLE